MVILIESKNDTVSTIGPVTISTPTALISYDGADFDYIVEGYVDISALESGDTLDITEYIAVDGENLQVFKKDTFIGAQSQPIVRFHSKTLAASFLYKVSVTQTTGTGRAYPIGFIQEVFNS